MTLSAQGALDGQGVSVRPDRTPQSVMHLAAAPVPGLDCDAVCASEVRVKARPSHRGRRVTQGVMTVVLVVGLGLLAGFAWDFFGTSLVADRAAIAEVAAFDKSVSHDPQTVALHTDFAAFPPPTQERTGAWGLLIVPSWTGKEGVYGDKIENRMPIKEGTTEAVLDSGAAGHFRQSQQVGEIGNFALAGHRRTHGNNFLYLDRLSEGMAIVIETADTWYVYEVTAHEVVPPTQWQVTAPVPNDPQAVPTDRLITLTTCHSLSDGAWGNDHRWVVHGRLVGWLEHDAGTPPQLEDATLYPPLAAAGESR